MKTSALTNERAAAIICHFNSLFFHNTTFHLRLQGSELRPCHGFLPACIITVDYSALLHFCKLKDSVCQFKLKYSNRISNNKRFPWLVFLSNCLSFIVSVMSSHSLIHHFISNSFLLQRRVNILSF